MEMKMYEGFCELNQEEMLDVEGGIGTGLKTLKLAARFGKAGLIVFGVAAVGGAIYEIVLGE